MKDDRFKSIYDFRDDDAGTATHVDVALLKLNYIGHYLSIGDSKGSEAILNVPYIRENKDRIVASGINIQPEACGQWEHMHIYECNAHKIHIGDATQDVVLCCMMLEHDPQFWKTLSEVRRVLKPGGIFLLTVPVYVKERPGFVLNPESAICYRVHGKDYYRYSLDSIAEVLMEGFVDKHLVLYQDPPRALCYGTKVGQV
jgi:SAM-dependent methyltransferase